MSDADYSAYLSERAALEAEGKRLIVAYSGGRRIAKAETREELLAQIAQSGATGEVLIQDVPEHEVSFREPLRVES